MITYITVLLTFELVTFKYITVKYKAIVIDAGLAIVKTKIIF